MLIISIVYHVQPESQSDAGEVSRDAWGRTISQLILVTPSTEKSKLSIPSPYPARFRKGIMNDPRQQSTCSPILCFFASLPSAGMGSCVNQLMQLPAALEMCIWTYHGAIGEVGG